MPLLGTEIGIAARDLIGLPPTAARYAPTVRIKAQRYVNFTARLTAIPQVEAAIFFLADGATLEWIDDGRGHGFTLGLDGWRRYGEALELTLKGQVAA
jgi:hypothetical protein